LALARAHILSTERSLANAHDPAQYVVDREGELPIEQREEIGASQALEEEMFLTPAAAGGSGR
jgi:hypothetical protein